MLLTWRFLFSLVVCNGLQLGNCVFEKEKHCLQKKICRASVMKFCTREFGRPTMWPISTIC